MNSHQRRLSRRLSLRKLITKYGSFAAINLPILRKSFPSMIASQIVGVQPMTGATGQIHTLRVRYPDALNFTLITDHFYLIPNDYCVVDVAPKVASWIEEQDITLWKPIDNSSYLEQYTISNTLYTLMALRWS